MRTIKSKNPLIKLSFSICKVLYYNFNIDTVPYREFRKAVAEQNQIALDKQPKIVTLD